MVISLGIGVGVSVSVAISFEITVMTTTVGPVIGEVGVTKIGSTTTDGSVCSVPVVNGRAQPVLRSAPMISVNPIRIECFPIFILLILQYLDFLIILHNGISDNSNNFHK
jgi:hypothetical protein